MKRTRHRRGPSEESSRRCFLRCVLLAMSVFLPTLFMVLSITAGTHPAPPPRKIYPSHSYPRRPVVPAKSPDNRPPKPVPQSSRWRAQLTPLRAVWVWGDDATSLFTDRGDARSQFVSAIVASRVEGTPAISLVFIEDTFDLFSRNKPGIPYDAGKVRSLLALLHVYGVEVHLIACSHPFWNAGRGCAEDSVRKIMEYNKLSTSDTSWDGIQLALAPLPLQAWEPYASGKMDRSWLEMTIGEVADAQRLLNRRWPLGMVVGRDFHLQPELSTLEFTKYLDYIALLPYSLDASEILRAIAPWESLEVRFLIGLEVVARADGAVASDYPGRFSGGYYELEQLFDSVLELTNETTPIIGFGMHHSAAYQNMPPYRDLEGPPLIP